MIATRWRPERDDIIGWLVAAASATAVLAVTGIRAVRGGVQLVDERAYFELRGRDVFTSDHPWLGMGSSAGGTSGGLNHPGPLLFDYLAVPVRLLGGPVGITLAMVILNIVCLWVATLAARRLGGPLVATTVSAGAVVLMWTLGSDLLIDPWQPNALVLPAFALLAATAAAAGGHAHWLPVVVVLASLCAQTHLGDFILGIALVALATAGVVFAARRDNGVPAGRPLAVSGGLVLVLWAQPLWQQFFGPGPGNLGRVVTGAGDASSRYGAGTAIRLVAAVVVVPPAWFRPGYDVDPPQALTRVTDGRLSLDTSRLPSTTVSVLAVMAVMATGAVLAHSARRRGIEGALPLLAVAASGLVVAFCTLVVMPGDLFGVLVHKYRFLWPVAAFATASLAAVSLRILADASVVSTRRIVTGVAVIGVVAAVANLPARLQTEEGRFPRREIWPVIADLRAQVAAAGVTGPVVIDTDTPAFPDYYLVNVLAELDRRDVEVQVTSGFFVGQLGRRRQEDGSATAELFVRSGPAAAVRPPGATTIARVETARPELDVAVYARPTEADR